MYPSAFEYFSPESVEDAIELLEKYSEDAKVLAGGQSLIPIMKLRLASFPYLIDITRIEGLRYIKESGNGLSMGSLVNTGELTESELVKRHLPILAETASQIADLQVRNMGTVGGNIVHGDPGNDLPATMMALDARFIIAGRGATRKVSASDFFVDSYQTAIEQNEILTHIEIPYPAAPWGGAYVKYKRRSGDFSLAAVACVVGIDGSGSILSAKIGLTSVAPAPMRCRDAENYLKGRKLGDTESEAAEEIIGAAADKIAASVDPPSDNYATSDFKRTILRIIAAEAIEKAYLRARGV